MLSSTCLARILAILAAREDDAAELSEKFGEAVTRSKGRGQGDPVRISTTAPLRAMRTPRTPLGHSGVPKRMKRDLPQ